MICFEKKRGSESDIYGLISSNLGWCQTPVNCKFSLNHLNFYSRSQLDENAETSALIFLQSFQWIFMTFWYAANTSWSFEAHALVLVVVVIVVVVGVCACVCVCV